jgi:hypothetical protein
VISAWISFFESSTDARAEKFNNRAASAKDDVYAGLRRNLHPARAQFREGDEALASFLLESGSCEASGRVRITSDFGIGCVDHDAQIADVGIDAANKVGEIVAPKT